MNSAARILVVDDTQSFRFMIQGYLEDAGYHSTCVASGSEALVALEQRRFDLILSDMVMLGMDGIALLRHVRLRHPQLPFVLVTAHGSIDNAVATMKSGADDYLQKPLNRQELLAVVQRLLEHARLKSKYGLMLASEWESHSVQTGTGTPASPVGMPPAAQRVEASPYGSVSRPGGGEGGTGRNGFAAAKYLVIPDTLPENELFSEVKGVFIGPDSEPGRNCGRSDDGGVFLDEIGDMLSLQATAPRDVEAPPTESTSDLPLAAALRAVAPLALGQEESWDRRARRAPAERHSYPAKCAYPQQRREETPQLTEQLNRFRQHEGNPLPGLGDPIFRTRA